MLDPNKFEFEFVNGRFIAAPAPSIDLFYDGPYYVYFRQPTAEHVKPAIEWLYNYLEKNGPYDVLMGFSQGCSLISALLLYHAHERRSDPLPFKGAIFICGGIPLPILEDMGYEVPQEAKDISAKTSTALTATAGSISEVAAAMSNDGSRRGLWDEMNGLAHDPDAGFPTDKTNVYGLDFTVFPQDLFVKIPTVHVYGRKDPRLPAGMQLAHFCDEGQFGSNRKVYDHGGGHDVPKTTAVGAYIASLVRWLDQTIEA
ncbi:serine hydrolase FSH [Xylogone sp. PMI_703]|nr:serine hydrolase FSH [Xylogone sp. PMI_703]